MPTHTPRSRPTVPHTQKLLNQSSQADMPRERNQGGNVVARGNPRIFFSSDTSTFSRGARSIYQRNSPSIKGDGRQAPLPVAPRRTYSSRFGGTQLAPVEEDEQLTANTAPHDEADDAAIRPSEAPGRSSFGADWRSPSRATTQFSTRTQNQWVRTQTCVRSPFTRSKFRRGQIISLPFHQPNLAQDVAPTDPALTISQFGPVYTKRRMAVVLLRFRNEMLCLPIYSWGARGIEIKPRPIRDQYMEIINAGPDAGNYQARGFYQALQARLNRPLSKKSSVCLAAGFRVDYHEDLLIVGDVVEESVGRMVLAWETLKDQSLAEGF